MNIRLYSLSWVAGWAAERRNQLGDTWWWWWWCRGDCQPQRRRRRPKCSARCNKDVHMHKTNLKSSFMHAGGTQWCGNGALPCCQRSGQSRWLREWLYTVQQYSAATNMCIAYGSLNSAARWDITQTTTSQIMNICHYPTTQQLETVGHKIMTQINIKDAVGVGYVSCWFLYYTCHAILSPFYEYL